MKKTIKLAVVAALALGSTSAFATNGANLIGLGAKSRAMGGVSIATAHGAENGLVNAALITTVDDAEISFGGTFFMPDVENTTTLMNMYNPTGPVPVTASHSSAADLSVIPEVSIASKVTDNFYMGIGMWGTAGMGVDYRDADGQADTQMQMVTNLQLMQFGVPLAYKISGFSMAITPLIQYGSLDINYVFDANDGTSMTPVMRTSNTQGVAQDLQFGYNIGLSYEISGFTIGAMYKSQIDMEYKGQISKAMNDFGMTGYTNDELSTPAELGIGVSYKIAEHTIGLDYKSIGWSDAKGYEDFKWEDQDVIALGYEYATNTWALRAGYNYAASPISEQALGSMGSLSNGADIAGLINTFNLLGFPGIIESHYTIGGSYSITNKTSLDLAYVYAPEVSETYKNFFGQDITTTHSQTSLSAQVNFKF
jgi:long-chain fatty acid transport protein